MRRAVPAAVYSTMGQASRSGLGLDTPYRYGGDKPLAAEPPRRVPNPKGGTPPDSTARKAERLAKFEVILTELSGGDLEHAPDAVVRKAGELVGVALRKAQEYRKELLLRGESRDA